jgi:hypothetical protein
VATKSGSVLITAWSKQVWEEFPGPPPQAPVVASWRLDEDEKVFEQFHDVDAAIEWARERASVVFVRTGTTGDTYYSAGEERAGHNSTGFISGADERTGPNWTPLPEWPPSKLSRIKRFFS